MQGGVAGPREPTGTVKMSPQLGLGACSEWKLQENGNSGSCSRCRDRYSSLLIASRGTDPGSVGNEWIWRLKEKH